MAGTVTLSLGEVYALVCAFLWATNGLVLRSQAGVMSPAAMNAWRCGVAALPYLLLLPLDRPLASLLVVPMIDWAYLFGSLIAGPTIGATLYIIALREIGASRAMPLTGTYPLATLLFEWLLLGQAAAGHVLYGTLLVVAGIGLLAGQRGLDSGIEASRRARLGVLLAIVASLLWGLSTVLLKPALEHLSVVQANAVRLPAVAAIVYLALVRPSGQPLFRAPRRPLVIIGAIGLISQGLGSYTFLAALDLIGAARTVTISSTYPVIGLIMAALILKERVTVWVVLGAGCCMAGVYLVL